MADWVELPDGTIINLDRVDCIVPTSDGARIVFSGTEEDAISVRVPPRDIMAGPQVRRA